MIERKYKALIERSFKTKVDVFLFTELERIGKISKPMNDKFIDFLITDEIAGKYEDSWQLTEEKKINQIVVEELDKQIENWNKENVVLKSELLEVYINHFKQIFPMSEFEDFYKKSSDERRCSYCNISETEILNLRGKGLIKTKRNRGKQMEIDRINSNMEYTKSNIVLACYWCNNAKTDEFTPTEFKAIGEQIRKIWNNRINKVNVS